MRKWYSGLLTAGLITAAGLAIGAVNSADADASVFAASGNASGNAAQVSRALMHKPGTNCENTNVAWLTMKTEVADTVNAVMVGVAKEKNGQLTVANWDVYSKDEFGDGWTSNTVSVDLSKMVNVKKDTYVMVKADYEEDKDALLVKVTKSDSVKNIKVKAKVESDGKVSVEYNGSALTSGEGVYLSPQKPAAVTYHTASADAIIKEGSQYSAYDLIEKDGKISEETFKTDMMVGRTYYISDVVEIVDKETKTDVTQSQSDMKTAQGDTVKCWSGYKAVQTPKIAIAKVKIPKRANGPKISVNYVTSEVTLPANTEYRLVRYASGNGYASGEYVPVAGSWVTNGSKGKLGGAALSDKTTFKIASADYAAQGLGSSLADESIVSEDGDKGDVKVALGSDLFAIDIRTARSGKLKSKISHNVLPAFETLVGKSIVSADSTDVKASGDRAPSKVVSANAQIKTKTYGSGVEVVDGLKLTYSIDSKGKYVLTATNSAKCAYNIVAGSAKPIKVAAGKSNVKIIANDTGNQVIKVAKVGAKATKTTKAVWSTAYLTIAETATNSPTPAPTATAASNSNS